MIRSQVLLHCSNARIGAARTEVWEGKDPGGIRVLMANPRWKKRFLRFLELSRVGRVVAERTDEDAARAARLGNWVVREAEDGAARGYT